MQFSASSSILFIKKAELGYALARATADKSVIRLEVAYVIHSVPDITDA